MVIVNIGNMNRKGFTPTPIIKQKMSKNKLVWGFTLLEILVAALILALVTTGLAYVFLAGKRHLLHTRSKIQATELGRLFLAPLQMDVTMSERTSGAQNGWGQVNNCLTSDGTSPGCPVAQPPVDGITYTPTYQNTPLLVDAQNPLGRLRKVKVTINWTEPSS